MHLTLSHGFSLMLCLAMATVIISDAERYLIPNWLNGIILLLYVAAVLALPLAPWPAVAAAGMILAVGMGLFALGLMGGGDIKLLVVLSLWTGWGIETLQFLFMTAMMGGLLVVVVLLLRFFTRKLWHRLSPPRNPPRLLTRGQPVPYGIAIAAGFLWLLLHGNIPGLPAL